MHVRSWFNITVRFGSSLSDVVFFLNIQSGVDFILGCAESSLLKFKDCHYLV